MKPLLIKIGTAAAALAAGAGLAILSPSSAANADTSGFAFSIQGPATLISHGVAISVPVEFSCPAGMQAELSVTVYQSVGKRIASGSGQPFIDCTGSPEALQVMVTSDGNVAFSKGGTALARGGVFGCGSDGCGSANDTATIRIR